MFNIVGGKIDSGKPVVISKVWILSVLLYQTSNIFECILHNAMRFFLIYFFLLP